MIGVWSSDIPVKPDLYNADTVIEDIYKRFIAIRNEDFEQSYAVFRAVFDELHDSMKDIDEYYATFSGSIKPALHQDKLHIRKFNDFDCDLVIELPNDGKTIKFSNSCPDEISYINLIATDENTRENKSFAEWLHGNNISRPYVWNWFKRIFYSAFEKFNKEKFDTSGLSVREKAEARKKFQNRKIFVIDGQQYFVSASGPHELYDRNYIHLVIENEMKRSRIDVRLTLALKLPIESWPVLDYSVMPAEVNEEFWMVKPRPVMWGTMSVYDGYVAWQIAMCNQERQLITKHNLKMAFECLRKLRDVHKMDISDYYIESLCTLVALQSQSIQPPLTSLAPPRRT